MVNIRDFLDKKSLMFTMIKKVTKKYITFFIMVNIRDFLDKKSLMFTMIKKVTKGGVLLNF